MFNLNTGTYASLERALLDDLKRQRENDPLAELLVLAPATSLLTHLQEKLAAVMGGTLQIHFLSFYGLAERLRQRHHLGQDRLVTEPALIIEVVRDLLEGRGEFINRPYLLAPGRALPRGL